MPAMSEDALQSSLVAALDDSSLHLVVLPTEQCNFRCTYCYEDFAIGHMSADVEASLCRLLSQRLPTLGSLFVEWFGGEPLLALDVVERVSEHVLDATAGTPTRYAAGITTNGWFLTPESASRLVGWGVGRAQVSLDGPREWHDRTRRRRGGQGSYDRIHANLHALRDSDVPLQVLLRVHLTPENAAAMPAFVDRLREVYLDDPRFSLLLTRVAHLGGPHDEAFEILGDAEAHDLIVELSGGQRRGLSTKADRVDVLDSMTDGPSLDVCYAAKWNSFVIRADGRVDKCTVALDDPRNTVGRLEPDGTIALSNPTLAPWTDGWFARDPAQLACPLETVPALAERAPTFVPLASVGVR